MLSLFQLSQLIYSILGGAEQIPNDSRPQGLLHSPSFSTCAAGRAGPVLHTPQNKPVSYGHEGTGKESPTTVHYSKTPLSSCIPDTTRSIATAKGLKGRSDKDRLNMYRPFIYTGYSHFT